MLTSIKSEKKKTFELGTRPPDANSGKKKRKHGFRERLASSTALTLAGAEVSSNDVSRV
jgi:hypothetical protein